MQRHPTLTNHWSDREVKELDLIAREQRATTSVLLQTMQACENTHFARVGVKTHILAGKANVPASLPDHSLVVHLGCGRDLTKHHHLQQCRGTSFAVYVSFDSQGECDASHLKHWRTEHRSS